MLKSNSALKPSDHKNSTEKVIQPFQNYSLIHVDFQGTFEGNTRDRRRKRQTSLASFTYKTSICVTWSTHRSSSLKSIKNP